MSTNQRLQYRKCRYNYASHTRNLTTLDVGLFGLCFTLRGQRTATCKRKRGVWLVRRSEGKTPCDCKEFNFTFVNTFGSMIQFISILNSKTFPSLFPHLALVYRRSAKDSLFICSTRLQVII